MVPVRDPDHPGTAATTSSLESVELKRGSMNETSGRALHMQLKHQRAGQIARIDPISTMRHAGTVTP